MHDEWTVGWRVKGMQTPLGVNLVDRVTFSKFGVAVLSL